MVVNLIPPVFASASGWKRRALRIVFSKFSLQDRCVISNSEQKRCIGEQKKSQKWSFSRAVYVALSVRIQRLLEARKIVHILLSSFLILVKLSWCQYEAVLRIAPATWKVQLGLFIERHKIMLQADRNFCASLRTCQRVRDCGRTNMSLTKLLESILVASW